MNRTILALPFMLLPLGCSLCADTAPFLQTAPLAGDAAGLKRFEGRWFDEEGNLIAAVSGSPEPRLSVLIPKELEPKDARLRNGEIVFGMGSYDEVSLRLTGEDEMQVIMGQKAPAPLSASSCFCTQDPVPVLVLVRDPSPAWLLKLMARKASQEGPRLARKAYDGAWDVLARTL